MPRPYRNDGPALARRLPLVGDTLSLGAGIGLDDHVFQNGTISRRHVA